MNTKLRIVAIFAFAAFAVGPAVSGAKVTREYDQEYKGKPYHYICILKKPTLEMCGNWKVVK